MALVKYNVTFDEMLCVCFARCPWRPPTDLEKEMLLEMEEYGRIIEHKRLVRQIIMGVAYTVIFILGVTGMI